MSTAQDFDTSTRPAAVSLGEPSDYWRLLKPRVMRLVIFTALVGMVLAQVSTGAGLHPVLAIIALLCIAVGAGASGALNMWYDADIDAVMTRTAKRPVPEGKVAPNDALFFGGFLSIMSVMTLGVTVNWAAAALLAFTIFFYIVIYTAWLKRSTPQNIVIGGAAGAFPPMVGWAAVSGTVSWESVVLFAIIFMWTPPHFWALALWKMRDYDDANVPMMPNVVGEVSTRRQMLIYSVLLAPVTVAPYFLGYASMAYGVAAALASAWFVWLTYKVFRDAGANGLAAEKRLFFYSIAFLYGVFAALLVDGVGALLIERFAA
ncbi:MAG: heme o synthase [Pseudomonadota bacterium]